jgi:integrase
MVWSPAQCGAFLDSIEAERLYALYHLAAYWGLRRSELVGLEWADLDLKWRRLHVRQAQADYGLDSTQSEDSDRILIIDLESAAVLETWQERQLFERLEWGAAWQDSGRVFTREDGSPLRAGHVGEHLEVLIRRADLPPIRFHDLRHGSASMLQTGRVGRYADSWPDQCPQQSAPHSATRRNQNTAGYQYRSRRGPEGSEPDHGARDVSVHGRRVRDVLEEMGEAAATGIAAFVPRKARREAA